MEIIVQQNCQHINWQQVAELLQFYGLSDLDASTQQLVFSRSYAVVFLLQNKQVVGVGRALSDGICQAAIYNVAVAEHLHGQQFGRLIIDKLVEQLSHCNIILYTHPQTVKFYQRLGFSLMKTGLVHYGDDHLEAMREMGFV